MTDMTFAQRRSGTGARLPYYEAGAGPATVVAIVGATDEPSRAHALLAEHRRVLVFPLPTDTDAGAAQDAGRRIGEAAGSLGAAPLDVMGEGSGAAAALWLARAPEVEIGSVVLVAPDTPPDAAFREMTRPVLLLAGTDEAAAAAGHRYCAMLPDCHLMFVYDAGSAIGVERPEALAFIANEFFERRDLFLVSRESGQKLP